MVKFKRLLKYFLQTSIIGLISLLLFERMFRAYVIDFYAGTFNVLNSHMEQREGNASLLIIGDSFSAFANGYPQVLHDSLTQYRLRNYSVPGTSITEQKLFGTYHIKRRQPEIIVFQFYVGNDFLGWRHELNWKDIPLERNLYWGLSDRIISVAYLNYKLSRLRVAPLEQDFSSFREKPFNPELYSFRDRYYFKTEPGLVENTAYLKGNRNADFEPYADHIGSLFEAASDDARIYFLMIPHCSQVTEDYRLHTQQLGGVFSSEFMTGEVSYPLYQQFEQRFENDQRVKVLNPIPYMKDLEDAGMKLYFNNDSHLNPLGQQKMGEYLLNVITHDERSVK